MRKYMKSHQQHLTLAQVGVMEENITKRGVFKKASSRGNKENELKEKQLTTYDS